METAKKLGALSILTTMISGLFFNAYAQIRENELEIARLRERNRGLKEIVIKIEANVEFIRQKVENIN